MPRPHLPSPEGHLHQARRAAPLLGALLLGLLLPTEALAVPVIDFPGAAVINPTVLMWHDDDLAAGPFTVLLGTSAPPSTVLWSGLTTTQQVTPALADGHYFWRVTDTLGSSAVSDFYMVSGLPPTPPIPEPSQQALWLCGLAGLAGWVRLSRHRR